MKKLALPLALLLVFCCGAAHAEEDAIAAFAKEAQGKVTAEEMRSVIEAVGDESAREPIGGEVFGTTYTAATGFSFDIPQDWELLPELRGGAYALLGRGEDQPVLPSITVLQIEDPPEDFLIMPRETIDVELANSLPGYQPIALDEFEFLEVSARELVCMYGASESNMLMQYLLLFEKEDHGYIITMTTLAEEAAHDKALETYDAFLTTFNVFEKSGSGGNG